MKDNYPAILGGDKIRNKNFKPRKKNYYAHFRS